MVIGSGTGPSAIAVTPVDATCGNNNGSVTLGAVTGGVGPYQYNFNGAGLSANLTYNNLAAGNYTLVVQDANGCTFNAPDVVIGSGTGPSAIAVTPVDATCGNNNGSVTLGAVTGGVGPYQYNFNGAGLSANLTYNNLAAGNYTLVVQDANGCTFNAPDVVIGSGTGPSAIAVTPVDATCGNNNGSVTLGAVTGGVVLTSITSMVPDSAPT